MKTIEKTRFYSTKIGELPEGCKMCVKGRKLVLYITGICPRKCWYCPLSENRKDIDIIYANETKSNSIYEIIKEAEICSAKGAGITGGDPLAKIDRTVCFISELKKHFGKDFHIHLYTTFVYASQENLERLFKSGLDEIRFHPDFENKKHWERIDLALKFNWDVGLEIPLIPKLKNKTIEMIDYFDQKGVKFLNLNELEIAETNSKGMDREKYLPKKDISPAVLGSDKLGKEILEYMKEKNMNVHYCPSKLKDKVQMLNRYKLRAKKVATKYDIITDEGLLIKGCIYLNETEPINNNIKEISIENKKEILKKLKYSKSQFEKEGLDVIIDKSKLRIITYPEHIEQFSQILKKQGFIPAIIEEDPTSDKIEINRHLF